jgi:hypothetical protein
MSQISGMPPANMRLDMSRSDKYLYPEAPKLGFFQKLGRTLGKAVSFLAPIVGSVAAVALPGIGLPIAAGCYGLGKLSGDMVRGSYAKQQNAVYEQQQMMANTRATTPGLFEQDDAGAGVTNFMAPSEFAPQINQTIIDRDASRGGALENF